MSTLTQEEVDDIMAHNQYWYDRTMKGNEIEEATKGMTQCLYCETPLFRMEICACHLHSCQEGPLCMACMHDHIEEHIVKGAEA